MGNEVPRVQVLIGDQYPESLIAQINCSKRSIDIMVFDWRYYLDDPGCAVSRFNQSIVRASARGVKVRCLVHFPDIVPVLNKQGISARRIIDKQLLHSKMLIIDSETYAIGSHNYTQRAFGLNHECSVLVSDSASASILSAYFSRLWGK